MRTLPSLAALAAGVLLIAAPLHGQISGYYNDKFDFSYEVSGLPDFDQRREASGQTLGLTNDGLFYCGPTATMNLFGFIARNGFPQIEPGDEDWSLYTEDNGWTLTDRNFYNDVTEDLEDLALNYMGTNPMSGTGADGQRNGAIAWLDFYQDTFLDQFDVDTWGVDSQTWTDLGSTSPSAWEIAQYGVDGTVMVMRYGRYSWEDVTPYRVRLTSRNGGHMVAVQLVEPTTGVPHTIKYRNSSTSEDDSVLRQDLYRVTTRRAEILTVETVPAGSYNRTVLFKPDQSDISEVEPDKLVLIDDVMVIRPKFGFSITPLGNMKEIAPPGLQPGPFRVKQMPSPAGPIRHAQSAPNRLVWAALTDAVPGGEPAGLHILDPFAGTSTLAASMIDPKRLVFSRQRTLFVLDGFDLIHYDLFGAAPTEIGRVTLPSLFPGEALDYDDRNDEVVVLSPAGVLLRYARNLASGLVVESVPSGVSLSGTLHVVADPTNDDVWISSVGGITQLVSSPTGAYSIGAQGGSNIDSISLDDRGNVFAASGGQVVQYRIDASSGRLVVATSSPFSGRQAGPMFQISRGRTNLDPELYNATGSWDITEPDVDPDPEEPNACAADFNNDGFVNSGDFISYLNAWNNADPTADFNDDQVINSQDFIAFLNVWNAGC